MSQAVFPFLGYMVLQLFVTLAGLNVVRDKEIGASGVLKSWIFGQMLLFAVLQVMAVPMILLRWKFDALFWSYSVAAFVLFSFGTLRIIKKKTKIRIRITKIQPYEMILLLVVILLILWQAGIYLFGMHLDEDDARWLVEANDALEYGQMMTRSFPTGEYLGYYLQMEDVTSPWPIMYAVLSKTFTIRVAIIAHTLYPSIELILVYGAFYLIAKELFSRVEARLTFVIFVALVMLFYGGTVYTQGVFTLVRIWQGKASVAAVIVPILLYLFVCLNTRDMKGGWLLVTIVSCAACLMSGMGVSISLIMIGVFGLYHIFAYQNWKRIPLWITSMLPSLLFGITYYCLKG